MNLIVEESARQAAQQWQAEDGSVVLRLYIEGKSCDGFSYGVCVDVQNPEDQVWSDANIKIVVDPQTSEFVEGCRIEFVDDERGRGFLVNNPKQHLYRGKFFKRPSWLASRQQL